MTPAADRHPWTAWDAARVDRLRADWGRVSVRDLAEREKTSVGAIYRMARKLGLKTKERKYPPRLAERHPAIRRGGTKYPKTVVSAKESPRVLVDGGQSRKLGSRVTKGIWRGLPIYSLTLEERASCPDTCREWLTCYGNGMHFARRHRFDGELLKRIDVELDMLAAKHRGGFLVRLHVLGDFGSDADEGLPYVALWQRKLGELPGLHLFGFTAHDRASAVGRAVMTLNTAFPERVRIRFSGSDGEDGFGALVIDRHGDGRNVVCPFESDSPKRPKDCGACGLCWTMARTVEFVRH